MAVQIIQHAHADDFKTLALSEHNTSTKQLMNDNSLETPGAGVKYDAGKVRVDLLPTYSIEEIARALTFGKNKYGEYNWTKGLAWSRMIGACLRHLFAFMRGEDNDPESGLSHLAHAGCCIVFLIWHNKYKRELDDRFKDPILSEGVK